MIFLVELIKEVSKDPTQAAKINLFCIKLFVSQEHVFVQFEQLSFYQSMFLHHLLVDLVKLSNNQTFVFNHRRLNITFRELIIKKL